MGIGSAKYLNQTKCYLMQWYFHQRRSFVRYDFCRYKRATISHLPFRRMSSDQQKGIQNPWYSQFTYTLNIRWLTVYPKKYAHGFVVLCFVVVMQSFIMNSHEVFIHIHQGCFAGTGAIVRLPQCQWSKPGGYGKISQCITTTKHSKAKTVCIFLGIYCSQISYIINIWWLSHIVNILVAICRWSAGTDVKKLW